MGKYKNSNWYIKSSKELIEKHNDIPPPWVYAPEFHPYSMGWRMGGGETHIMILQEWLDQMSFDYEERLKYLKKYPASPRWYQWIINFLWNVDSYKFEENDYLPYFNKLKELGFKNTDDFEKDMNRDDLD